MMPTQVELARHALGLPNKRRMSYRNYFIAGPGHSDFDDWTEMVAIGVAVITRKYNSTGETCFRLTRAGAGVAIKRGERLCPEDFPKTPVNRLGTVSAEQTETNAREREQKSEENQ